jgi:hypothetical protein
VYPSRTLGSVSGEQKTVLPHDAEDALVLDGRAIFASHLAPEQCRDAAIAIGGPFLHDPPYMLKHRRILRFGSFRMRLIGPLQPVMEM